MKKVLVIGIAGGSGSGKSTLTDMLFSEFKNNIAVIRHDDYYKDHSDLSLSERAKLNYDCPDAFDTDMLIDNIKLLKMGIPVDSPVYDYKTHNRSSDKVHIAPSPVILIDGILILENEELRSLMDIKVFVDTDADIRILRRIERDVIERGRELSSVIEQYRNTVKPMHEKYVQPSRRFADIVVLNGGFNGVANDMLINRIKNHLSYGE